MSESMEASLAREAFFFRNSLDAETDRGCALMAAAYLSDQLERLLRAVFVGDSARVDRLFHGTASLSDFSARIDLCYAIGFLPERARRDLHLIRKIRNRFGHTAQALTFDDAAIASQCRELYYRVSFDDASGRDMFTSAALAVCGRIDSFLADASNAAVPEDVVFDDELRSIAATLADLFPPPGDAPDEFAAWFKLTRRFADALREHEPES